MTAEGERPEHPQLPAPGSRRDATLRAVYADVLADVDVPVDDQASFFALGGSSLLVLVLLERVAEELGVVVEMEEFYEEPTLAGLRATVERRAPTGKAPATSPLVALLADAPRRDGADRPAVVAPDGSLSWAEVLDVVSAASRHAGPSLPAIVRVGTDRAGVRAVLDCFAARRPALLLADDATEAEERQASAAFLSELPQPPDPVRDAVHAVATSGSTGRPKVVVAGYDGTLAVQVETVRALGLGPDDVVLVAAPLHYGFGMKTGMLAGLIAGATVVLPELPLTPQGLRRTLSREAVTTTVGVSLSYRLLLASGASLPALRRAVVGGDPLPPDLAEQWAARTGVRLIDSYGSSESNHVSFDLDGVPGSVGRPLPGVQARVLRDDGSVAEHGEGELLLRSPGLARGYAADPELTARRFRDGWLHTGDAVQLREDGHLLLRGRLDDQLNVAGSKVDPREVEAVCRELLELTDCAVLGVAGRSGVVEVCAYVVADRPVTRPQLARALAGRLSAHKIPTRVVQLPSLPRGANGKLQRSELLR